MTQKSDFFIYNNFLVEIKPNGEYFTALATHKTNGQFYGAFDKSEDNVIKKIIAKINLTPEQAAVIFSVTTEQIKNQYRKNIIGLEEMYTKATRTGRKVNGYTADELKEKIQEFKNKSK